MKKVWGFFKSIRLKFILIYILLILIAIQIIGAYFARQLETQLLENFTESVNERVQLLNFNLEQAFSADRSDSDLSLQSEVRSIIHENFNSDDFTEVRVVDNNSRVLATTSQFDRSNVGKRTTELRILRALSAGNREENILFNRDTGNRTLVISAPIESNTSSEILGAIYLQASIEGVYDQMEDINRIFANGTILAITVSALLGVLVAQTITKPISEMRRQATVMATGDFSQKVNVYGKDEIGELAITFNDLNDKLRLSYAATEGERRKLSSVLRNMTDGVIATDKEGKITLLNEPAMRLLQRDYSELHGEPLLSVLGMDEDYTDLFEIKDENSLIIDFSESGRDLLLKANFSVIEDEVGEMNGFLTVLSDVTEQEKIERERREFVANVSHELRTPLTTMRSYLEALSDESTLKNEELAPKFLGVTQNETERMIRLVNDLLQLSKMDNKDFHFHKERIEYVNFIDAIVDRFEMNLKEELELKRVLPKKQLEVWIDPDKITQVIDNIISNAIKYSPEGGTIKVEVLHEKNQVITKISDQGMGIPQENLERIFDRFYRVDKARTRKLGGTGLGLAISRELLEAHDGNIWASSIEGKGTTIHFRLPLMRKKRGRHS